MSVGEVCREKGKVRREDVRSIPQLAGMFGYTRDSMAKLIRKHNIRNAYYFTEIAANGKRIAMYFPCDIEPFVKNADFNKHEKLVRQAIQNDFLLKKTLRNNPDILNRFKQVLKELESDRA